MSKRLTHYERMTTQVGSRKRARALIERVANDPMNPTWKVLPLAMGHAVNQDGEEMGRWKNAKFQDFVALQYELVKWILDNQDDPYSYSQAMTNPDFHGMMNFYAEVITPGSLHATMNLNYQMASHERAGKRVYDVSPGLAEQLRYTELRGLNADDLRLPYESIYIQVPPEAGLKIWNSDTGWHDMVGVYITEERCMNEDDAYRREGIPGEHRGWRFLMIGKDKATTEEKMGDDALSFFRILLKDDMKLNDIIKHSFKEMRWNTDHNPDGTWDERMTEDWEQQFRWCMNVVLYITWSEPGEHWISNKQARQLWERIKKLPPKSKKRGNLSRKLQNMDQQRRIRLGTSIVIDRKRAPSDGESRQRLQLPPHLRIKTRVCGHWRRVPCGKGRKDRRLKRIEPFWRNKDGIELEDNRRRELR